MKDLVLVWLEWPESCFRVGARSLAFLRTQTERPVIRVRSERAFLRELPRATHAVVWHFRSEWFARAPRLKVLATPGAGRELVAQDAPEGVRVHFGGFHGDIMAESVAAFMLAAVRGFLGDGAFGLASGASRTTLGERLPAARAALAGRCRTLAGTRAVIAGYGRIGRAIGRKLEALGVSVEGFTRANVASLPAAARTADWFVMALPSDTGTDGFLSRRLLAKLPRRCCVVNVGRGNAIDEEALLAALRSGRIAGAYLDVFQGERTMRRGSVQAPRDEGPVLSLRASEQPPNLFVMPHAAAFSPDYLVECFRELKREGLV